MLWLHLSHQLTAGPTNILPADTSLALRHLGPRFGPLLPESVFRRVCCFPVDCSEDVIQKHVRENIPFGMELSFVFWAGAALWPPLAVSASSPRVRANVYTSSGVG